MYEVNLSGDAGFVSVRVPRIEISTLLSFALRNSMSFYVKEVKDAEPDT